MKKVLFLAACLLAIAYAPAAAKDGTTQGPPATAQARAAPSTTAGRTLPRQSVQDTSRGDSIPAKGPSGHRLIGRLDAADNAVFGVGIWRVRKDDRLDPNRHNLLRDPGKLSGVAAVGFNLAF